MGRAKGTQDEGRHLPHPQGRPSQVGTRRGRGELRRNPKNEARNHVSSPPRRRGTKGRSQLSVRAPPFGRAAPSGHASGRLRFRVPKARRSHRGLPDGDRPRPALLNAISRPRSQKGLSAHEAFPGLSCALGPISLANGPSLSK